MKFSDILKMRKLHFDDKAIPEICGYLDFACGLEVLDLKSVVLSLLNALTL